MPVTNFFFLVKDKSSSIRQGSVLCRRHEKGSEKQFFIIHCPLRLMRLTVFDIWPKMFSSLYECRITFARLKFSYDIRFYDSLKVHMPLSRHIICNLLMCCEYVLSISEKISLNTKDIIFLRRVVFFFISSEFEMLAIVSVFIFSFFYMQREPWDVILSKYENKIQCWNELLKKYSFSTWECSINRILLRRLCFDWYKLIMIASNVAKNIIKRNGNWGNFFDIF